MRRGAAAPGLALATMLAAAAAAAAAAPSDPRGPTSSDADHLAAFVDGAAGALLESEEGPPGLCVSVVRDGRVVLARGYGVASTATRAPVSAERTLFRIGSVSKLFLATAIMQQLERGRLDLETDVNAYLDGTGVRVPDAFGAPVALRHLMTHTAGFEEAALGETFAPSADAVPPLRENLARYLPARVRPPGALVAYSNHGTAVAALVVEAVSGVPYDVYLEREIFQPLGMTRTTSRQPVPDSLDGEVSTGARPPEFFGYVKIPPAGSISSTAADMAKFMLAHLQLGRFEGPDGPVRILREETARRMQQQLFTHDRRVSGLAHQFFEQDVNGRRAIGHGGGTLTHITWLALVPGEGLGFFASANAIHPAARTLAQLVFDRLLPPADRPPPVPMPGAAERLARYEGFYRESRSADTSPSRLADWASMQRASAGADGRLAFLGEAWIETEPGHFVRADGEDRLVFSEWSDAGGASRLVALRGNAGHSVLVRQPWWGRRDVQAVVYALALVVLLHPFVYRPWHGLRTWLGRMRGGGRDALVHGCTAVLRVAALAFAVSFAVGSLVALRDFDGALNAGWRIAFAVALLVPPLAAAVTLLAGLAWWQRRGDLRSRLALALVALAGLALSWWLDYWNAFLTRV